MAGPRLTLALAALLALGRSLLGALAACSDSKYELTVTVIEAKIPDMDWVGKSDAYALVALDGKVGITPTIVDNNHPVWGTVMDFGCVDPTQVMSITVFDYEFEIYEDEVALTTSWTDWSTYYQEVTRRLYSDTDDDGTYWIDLSVVYKNTTQQDGGYPTPAPTSGAYGTLSPTTIEEYCGSGWVPDCRNDGTCCHEDWIGDGFRDCEEALYGCDLSCYDDDGGDCLTEPPTQYPTERPTQHLTDPPTPYPATLHPSHAPTVQHHHHKSDSNEAGVAVGVTFGVLIGLAAVIALCYYYRRRWSYMSRYHFESMSRSGVTFDKIKEEYAGEEAGSVGGYRPPSTGLVSSDQPVPVVTLNPIATQEEQEDEHRPLT